VGRRLYVGNLSYQVQESELEQLFAQAGSVASVFVPRDKFTGQGRGFAFVEMGTDAEAQVAIEEFHEQSLGGRSMKVNEARPQDSTNAARSAGWVHVPGIPRDPPRPQARHLLALVAFPGIELRIGAADGALLCIVSRVVPPRLTPTLPR